MNLAQMGSGTTGVSIATATGGAKEWTPDTGINGGAVGAAETSVAINDDLTVSVTGAQDLDEWQEAGVTDHAADALTYTFSSVNAANATAGSWIGSGSSKSWIAPSTPGTYRLRCEVNDGGVVPAGDAGSRDDAPVMATELTVTVVTVAGLEYKDANNVWQAVPNPFYVAKGSSIEFRAVANPTGAAWPDEKPEWGGTVGSAAGATGTGPSKSVKFDVASTTLTDYKTVTAECGDEVTAQVVVFQITDLTATGATRVEEVVGDPDIFHFATPKGAALQIVTLTATVSPDNAAIRALIDWEGATEDANNPLVATTPKDSAAKHTVKIKGGPLGVVLQDARVWVIWCDIDSIRTGVPSIGREVIDTPTTSGMGTWITTEFTFEADILPTTIISHEDRPDFNIAPVSSVPNRYSPNVNDGYAIGQPSKKWDISRAVRIRALSPTIGTNDYADATGTIFDGLPDSNKIVQTSAYPGTDNYPSDEREGNDDSGDDVEDNNPYPPGMNIGKLTDSDAPRIPSVLDSAGAVGDTINWNVQFREFVRLEIGDTWYRVSDFEYWRFHSKLKKASEATDNQDYNGDGDKTDVLWINNGSVSDHTNQNF